MTTPKDVLVINCGSSSLKFALLSQHGSQPILSGLAERLGTPDAQITFRTDAGKDVVPMPDGRHAEALEILIARMTERDLVGRVGAIGHRVVHGGERFRASVLIDDDVIAGIEACAALAPLHNPSHVIGIRAAQKVFPSLPQVAVFDTAFHQTMPRPAYLYAIPQRYYTEMGVRRYGMHGTSHRYVASKAVRVLGLDPDDHGVLTAHLGNGASASAVRNGHCVDTTMGMTPLEGLIMGTRSGDIDPAAVTFIARRDGLDYDGIDELLNKRSGLLGISGLSSDCRVLEAASLEGHADAQLALDMFVHRLARLLGGLATSLERIDALVFTGGIGENSSRIRANTLNRLRVLGFELDEQANQLATGGREGVITRAGGTTAAVLATDEERLIADDTAQLANL